MARDDHEGRSGSVRRAVQNLRGFQVLTRAGMASATAPATALRGLADVRDHGPLVGALRHALRTRPNAAALVDEHGTLTYAELDRASRALALALLERGFEPGHTIAVLCRDHRWLVLAQLACGRIGVHVVLVNTGFAAPQLADVLAREDAAALVLDGEFHPLVQEARLRLPCFVAWQAPQPRGAGPSLADLVAEAEDGAPLPEPDRPGSVVLLTSGTTGRPKGARRQVRSALAAADLLDRIPLRAHERTFLAAPLSHAIGFSQLTVAFGLGSTVVVHRRFDPGQLARAVHENGCTCVVLVPTMLHRLLELDERFLRELLSSVRSVVVSGSVLAPALAQRASAVLGDVLYNLYGSTEAAVAAVATPRELAAAPGTVGRSPRGCAVRLYDEHNRRITRPHTAGRIFAGGQLAFTGYTTAGVGRGRIDGLIDTGDVGHFDGDGLLFVDGRADDMIISGAENVFPAEVENLIATHQAVKDVAVIGAEDAEFGQRLRAFVVPIPGAELEPQEIVEFVRRRLARHKVPREVVLVKSVPRNTTGKLVRRALA